ncbi:MAG: hypothetical protein HFI88_00995 [Lachnospiraceae bacterium]|nr:hypothetical protein [Lachnospiraceae bacterium]
MKKFISVLMAAALILCMGGCRNVPSETGAGTDAPDVREESSPVSVDDSAAVHKIGVAVYDVMDDEVIEFREYLTDYIKECFPEVEFCYSYTIRSAEDEMAFLRDACAEGAEGILSFITYDLREEVAYCESQGIYYMLASGTVSEDAYASVEDNPYFLGVTGPGSEIERQTGADMAEYFISEMDGDSYILFTGGAAIGNEMHRLRSVGALEVFAEHFGDLGSDVEELAVTQEPVKLSLGGIALTVYPGYTTREDVEKGAREELKNGDYDFALSMFSMYSMVDALKEEGVKQGVVDCYSMTNKELFEDGTLCYVAGKYSSIIGPSFAAMYNAVTGHAGEFRENGKAFRMTQGYWISRSKEEYNARYALATGIYVNAYNYEDLGSVMKAYDETASFEKLKALTEAWTYEEAENRRE